MPNMCHCVLADIFFDVCSNLASCGVDCTIKTMGPNFFKNVNVNANARCESALTRAGTTSNFTSRLVGHVISLDSSYFQKRLQSYDTK